MYLGKELGGAGGAGELTRRSDGYFLYCMKKIAFNSMAWIIPSTDVLKDTSLVFEKNTLRASIDPMLMLRFAP